MLQPLVNSGQRNHVLSSRISFPILENKIFLYVARPLARESVFILYHSMLLKSSVSLMVYIPKVVWVAQSGKNLFMYNLPKF